MSSANISLVILNNLNKEVMKQKSKSFSLASSFFGRIEKEACYSLYHWCRYCDDQIDLASTSLDAQAALSILKEETALCYQGQNSRIAAFKAFQNVVQTFQIPIDYPIDLLEGFSMDAHGIRIQTEEDLWNYCYRVAGVVGLMMCQIMGLNDSQARKNAVDLGMAMQMTNIARDVLEDFGNGRVYLPEMWLRSFQISPSRLFHQPEALYQVVNKLLEHAEMKYRFGFLGLKALPLRAALAVSIAGSVYRGIGRKIQKRGASTLFQRTYLNPFEKCFYVLEGSLRIFPIFLKRLLKPWKPVHLETIWKFTL